VEAWRAHRQPTAAAKLAIDRAFIAGDLEISKQLARKIHEVYFTPQNLEFEPSTMWILSNAFTSAFKELDSIPHYVRRRSWLVWISWGNVFGAILR
jgi:hypothetical protein